MLLDSEQGAIAFYLIDCRSRNLSALTIALYDRVLRSLSDLLVQLCSVQELEQVTVMHLRLCLQHCLTAPHPKDAKGRQVKNGETLSANSVRELVRIWKVFFNWCYQEELIEKNPVSRLKNPVVEKTIKPTLSSEDLQVMLNSCDLSADVGYRDFAILSVMADCGLRLQEITDLTLDNVHPTYIKVFGKGRKEREVGLHPEVAKIIWKYVQKHRHPYDEGEQVVFLTGSGTPLAADSIYRAVKRRQKDCGFGDKEIHPHVFRHTFSKQYMARGGDVLSLSRELGHSDIKVTRDYLEDFGSNDARKDHNSRSIFNDIKVSRRKRSRKAKDETDL